MPGFTNMARAQQKALMKRHMLISAMAPAAVLIWLAAGAAQAHPHVFIETGRGLVFDTAGRLIALDISWRYDALYSLLMITENGLDSDGDGQPDPARLAAYAGHDVDWAAGFPGHVDLRLNGQPLALAPPVDHRAEYADGHITTRHRRPLAQPFVPTATQLIELRAYDPEYFVAYDTPAPVRITGRSDCRAIPHRPKPTAGDQVLLDRLAQLDMTQDATVFANLPDVGITFATVDEIRCGG